MTFGGAGMLAGGAIGGALISGAAGQSAAGAQANASNQATNAQMAMFNRTQQNLSPYIQFGNNALTGYGGLLGMGGANGAPNTAAINAALQSMPGFQFANYYGQQGVQNSMAARGLGSSGAAVEGAANYATGLASQQYQNLLADYQRAAGMGANAAAGLGQIATTTGANVANTMQNAGAATAAGINSMGAGINNALTNGAAYGAWGLMNSYPSGISIPPYNPTFSAPSLPPLSVGNIWS